MKRLLAALVLSLVLCPSFAGADIITPALGTYTMVGTINTAHPAALNGSFYIGQVALNWQGQNYMAYCVDMYTDFYLGDSWTPVERLMSDYPIGSTNSPYAAGGTGSYAMNVRTAPPSVMVHRGQSDPEAETPPFALDTSASAAERTRREERQNDHRAGHAVTRARRDRRGRRGAGRPRSPACRPDGATPLASAREAPGPALVRVVAERVTTAPASARVSGRAFPSCGR